MNGYLLDVSDPTVIWIVAGSSVRCGFNINKQWMEQFALGFAFTDGVNDSRLVNKSIDENNPLHCIGFQRISLASIAQTIYTVSALNYIFRVNLKSLYLETCIDNNIISIPSSSRIVISIRNKTVSISNVGVLCFNQLTNETVKPAGYFKNLL